MAFFEGSAMAVGEVAVVVGGFAEEGKFGFGEVAKFFRGSARPQLTPFHNGPAQDKGTGGDHGLFFDDTKIQKTSLHTNEGEITKRARMQERRVADGASVPDNCRIRFAVTEFRTSNVDDRVILDIRIFTNLNQRLVASHNAPVPHTRVLLHLNVPNQRRRRCDPRCRCDARDLAIEGEQPPHFRGSQR